MLLAVSSVIFSLLTAMSLGAQEKTDGSGVSTGIPDLNPSHSVEEVELLVAPLTLEQLQAEADEWQQYVQAAMTGIARLKVAALDAEVIPIGCSPNGRNINDGCGSTATALL